MLNKIKLWSILGIYLLSLVSFNTIAQDKTTEISKGINTVYNDLKSTTPKIEKALASISKDLKVGANKVWDILVKQQLVNSITILICLIATLLSWFHFWYRIKIYQIKDNEMKDAGAYTFPCIITCIISIVGTILSIMHFSTMVTGFINPEYGALQTITEIAKTL